MFHRALKVLAAAGIALLCWLPGRAATAPSKGALYDADPNHLWNRLHRALFVRTDPDGIEYGFDQLDPLLWFHSTHLLEGPSHKKAIKVLDEFLATHGEKLVCDPLKRAILQRDLWAVFDWTAHGWPDPDPAKTRALRDLQPRLAAAIQRLALTKEQIVALPDNYEDAAKSRKFGNDSLPADLFSTNGPWVCVGLPGEERIAPTHVAYSGGRSAFLVFIQTPGGREEALNYLKEFREFPQPYVYKTNVNVFQPNQVDAVLSTNLPQFANGTAFALVRQMILVDQNGGLVPTHLTESVQIRRYNDVHPKRVPFGRSPTEFQSLFEFLLSRKQLFGGMAGGLRAVAPDETEFRQFMGKGFDPFTEAAQKHGPVSLWSHQAMDCMECHGGPGVYSVNSFLQSFQAPAATLPQIAGVDVREQRDAVCYLKQTQFNWGLLKGLWQQPYAASVGIHTAAADDAAAEPTEQSISSSNPPDRSLLHIAAVRGKTNEIALLIAQGADVNDTADGRATPLADMVAGSYATTEDQRYADVAAILLAHGATVDAPDNIGETPLLRAVEFGKIRLARVLMEHGASLSNTFTGTYSRLTPLFYAVEHGNKEMAALILEFKPPLETVDPEGMTPLLWAVKWDKIEMARLLLEHGASVTPTTNQSGSRLRPAQLRFFEVNNRGNTPLYWALIRHDKEMIALLLEFKAPLDIANQSGETPLDMVKQLDDPAINEIFLRAAPATGQGTPGAATTTVPSRQAMRAIAQRIADGDAAAFDELTKVAENLYDGIDYQTEHARVRLNLNRMKSAFDALGQEAGKGNAKAFQALKKSLGVKLLNSFAPDALGLAAAGGNKEALDILLHYKQWGILESTATFALCVPAKAGVDPAIDFFAAWLPNAKPHDGRAGMMMSATKALEDAAAKGNQKAKDVLEKFAAASAQQNR